MATEDYVYLSGKFDTRELSNREYGISTNGQYLITKHQEIVTKAYKCTVGDTKKTCYKQVWSTKKIEKKFLENYSINGATIDQSIVETLVEEFPLQEVFANTYPDKHIRHGYPLYPFIEDNQLTYKRNEDSLNDGDYKVIFYKVDQPIISFLGKIENDKIKPVQLLELPLIINIEISFEEFIELQKNWELTFYVLWTFIFIVAIYPCLIGLYLCFDVLKEAINKANRKIYYYISPLAIAILLHFFTYF